MEAENLISEYFKGKKRIKEEILEQIFNREIFVEKVRQVSIERIENQK